MSKQIVLPGGYVFDAISKMMEKDKEYIVVAYKTDSNICLRFEELCGKRRKSETGILEDSGFEL